MEKKIRIQLYDPEGRLSSDRLVTQDPEFTSGPKITHDGPIRIEFSLMDKDDIDKAKTYLGQLVGTLPKPEPRGRKPLTQEMGDDESRAELLEDALKQTDDQDKLIAYLRDHNFVFMTWDFFSTFDFKVDIKEKHQETHQWLIRQLKRAKNPKSDKYDPMLMIGIKLLGDRSEKIVIYLNGEYHASVKVDIPGKPKETFKKSGMMKFPKFMTEPERDKFRFEIRQYQANPNRVLSKFYKRWAEYVENAPELENPKE